MSEQATLVLIVTSLDNETLYFKGLRLRVSSTLYYKRNLGISMIRKYWIGSVGNIGLS